MSILAFMSWKQKSISAFPPHNQVNTNGVISFLINVNQNTPERFPLGDGRQLVAPFWGDADTRTTEKVFYRETSDRNRLIKAATDITSIYVECKAFRPGWLMIATWHEVPFYGARGDYTDRVWWIIQNTSYITIWYTKRKLLVFCGNKTWSGIGKQTT